jgi:hypothetical protein
MKNLIATTILASAVAGMAHADSFDADGLPWNLQRASVSCDGANVPSAMLTRGAIVHVVNAVAADACGSLIEAGDVLALPEGGDAKDLGDVEAFLDGMIAAGYDVKLRTSGGDPIVELVDGEEVVVGFTKVREFF